MVRAGPAASELSAQLGDQGGPCSDGFQVLCKWRMECHHWDVLILVASTYNASAFQTLQHEEGRSKLCDILLPDEGVC
jgi:hypothetical protein